MNYQCMNCQAIRLEENGTIIIREIHEDADKKEKLICGILCDKCKRRKENAAHYTS